MAWCSQRGVAHIKITETLLAQPGTTLMRPDCNARMPARTTGAGRIINSFNAGVIFLLRRSGESGVRHAGAKRGDSDAIALEFAMKGFTQAQHVGLGG